MTDNTSRMTRLALPIMLLAPLFFSSNLVFGRGTIGEVSPFMLAFLRWLAVAAALSPLMLRERAVIGDIVRTHWKTLVLLAFLGMWICGGGVYLALQWTTATNGTLIYTTSPVIILLLEAMFRGRRIGLREGIGSIIAFFGIVTIVLRGDPLALFSLDFNVGDLLFVAAAIAWATYSIIYRAPYLQKLSNASLLGLLASVGALLLLPVAMLEWLNGAAIPSTGSAWGGIAGIVVFASLLAFSSFQFGLRQLGPSLTGVFMYLMPPYGVLLAVVFLGERLEAFHVAGIALVMAGIVLATFPVAWLRERLRRA
ncbi:DMT family transporter [Neoaquamicrobium sediminum]|uniref:DMT family transporter n=1 Tax=Neoaquamicrobium sediminum TaxID=1849104 RepID=UPI003BAC3437